MAVLLDRPPAAAPMLRWIAPLLRWIAPLLRWIGSLLLLWWVALL